MAVPSVLTKYRKQLLWVDTCFVIVNRPTGSFNYRRNEMPLTTGPLNIMITALVRFHKDLQSTPLIDCLMAESVAQVTVGGRHL